MDIHDNTEVDVIEDEHNSFRFVAAGWLAEAVHGCSCRLTLNHPPGGIRRAWSAEWSSNYAIMLILCDGRF